MYFDTHAHYDDEQFDSDRMELLASMPEKGVSLIVNPASNMDSAARAVTLAESFPFVYAAVGVHPHDARLMTDGDLDTLREMLAHPKVVAVGEVGLDYHYDFSPREVQRLRFRQQMELAGELGLPVVVHERESLQDTLAIISEFPGVRGVLHCFSGSWETAKILLDRGWYISFTGAVTFKNARRAPDVAAKMPADRMMLETDCPYMAPVPLRGRRNDSGTLPYTARFIAQLRGTTEEEIARITMENGRRFFDIS